MISNANVILLSSDSKGCVAWNKEELQQKNLAKMKLPRSIDFMKKLPRDENGKLYKRKLRDPYWENHVAKV